MSKTIVPEIATERLLLREVKTADLEEWAKVSLPILMLCAICQGEK